MITKKISIEDLKIGDLVYIYELKDDGTKMSIISYQAKVTFAPRFNKVRCEYTGPSIYEGIRTTIGGYSGTPINNKIWFDSKNDRAAYSKLIEYYDARIKSTERDLKRFKNRKNFLLSLLDQCKEEM